LKSQMRTKGYIILITLLFLNLSPRLLSQTLAGKYSTRLDASTTKELLNYLSSEDKFKFVKKIFFMDTYDDELADIIFFIDERKPNNITKESSGNKPRIEIIKNNKRYDNLFGERFIYVTAFIATTGEPDTNSILYNPAENNRKHRCHYSEIQSSKDSLNIHMSALDQRPNSGEFALFSIIQTVSSAISEKPLANMVVRDSIATINLKSKVIKLGSNESTNLYFIFEKLPLKNNTINRIRLGEMGDKWLYQATFGNYSDAWLTSSVGILGSYPKKKHVQSDSTSGRDFDVTPFLFVHLYLFDRPKIPHPRYNNSYGEFNQKLTISLVVGTNLSDKLMKNIFTGFCIGHALSKVGVLFGCNFKDIDYYDKDRKVINTKREVHYSMGLSYIF
jgi:hypothetical protein